MPGEASASAGNALLKTGAAPMDRQHPPLAPGHLEIATTLPQDEVKLSRDLILEGQIIRR